MSALSTPAPASLSTAAPAKAAGSGVDREQLKAVAKQFEAVFARQIIGSMRAGSLGDDMLGSDAGNTFRDMADSRIADDMSNKGTFGIADLLLKQFGGPEPKAVTTGATTGAALKDATR